MSKSIKEIRRTPAWNRLQMAETPVSPTWVPPDGSLDQLVSSPFQSTFSDSDFFRIGCTKPS